MENYQNKEIIMGKAYQIVWGFFLGILFIVGEILFAVTFYQALFYGNIMTTSVLFPIFLILYIAIVLLMIYASYLWFKFWIKHSIDIMNNEK